MRATLDSEERTHLQKLQTEEQGVLNGLAESEKELAQQAREVRELISDVRHRLQGSTVAMLQDVKDMLRRSKVFTVKKPRTFPKKQRTVFQAPDLKKILQSQQAPVTLTASKYPNVAVSATKRQRRTANNPLRLVKLGESTQASRPVNSGQCYR
ncbi:PREDICTED: tripartite motif-containing protein 5-like isoform X1 [Chinchilla lanigera]|uniref:tripartite motif-containing protein 5-like isoform X1 n=1 Tax=Chinchilla lanigera TaxID=34839 RepID=UPI000697E42D|nr:PREDICTED: tripartite motif-containing protein 5-like isoform X1 [Chinchilla lanigera]